MGSSTTALSSIRIETPVFLAAVTPAGGQAVPTTPMTSGVALPGPAS